MLKILACLVIVSLALATVTSNSSAQSSFDRNTLNKDAETIRNLHIKSKTQWEYYYGDKEALRDSGYKSVGYRFDSTGKVTEYTKYHVYSDLTVKELYQYNKAGNIDNITRYNSKGDVIETIVYKYKRGGKLSNEQHTAYLNTVRPGVYFSILANVNDDSLFSKLQEDLEIEPKLGSYTIIVNITDPDDENQYVVIGDESDPSSPRFSWTQLSLASQRGLLAWQGPNKKEHTYIVKYIDRIIYKYDRKYNMTGREVYSTSNDLLEKEIYRYDSSNNKIAFYKYGEKGKLSSTENYVYDEQGRVSEAIAFNTDGKLASKLDFKYDDFNNLSEMIWFNQNGEINGKYLYKYDANDRLSEESKFRNDNERDNRTVFKYDDNGLIIEITKYDVSDKKERSTKFVYERYE